MYVNQGQIATCNQPTTDANYPVEQPTRTTVIRGNETSLLTDWNRIRTRTDFYKFTLKFCFTQRKCPSLFRHGYLLAMITFLLVSCYGSCFITSAFYIAAIVIGVFNLENCPAQHLIPIFLVVFGSVGMAIAVLGLIIQCLQSENCFETMPVCICVIALESICSLFQIGWYFAGNVWVFGAHVAYDQRNGTTYCHKTTFEYAFTLCILPYVLLMAAFFFCCCCCCCGVPLVAASAAKEVTGPEYNVNASPGNASNSQQQKVATSQEIIGPGYSIKRCTGNTSNNQRQQAATPKLTTVNASNVDDTETTKITSST